MNLTRKQKVTAGAATLMIVGGGVAFAYWTVGGSGSGTAQTGTSTDIVANQTSTVTGLRPGGAPVALTGNFDNPNTGPVYVSTVTASISGVTLADGVTGSCDAGDYTLANAEIPVNAEVPPGDGVGSWGVGLDNGPTIAFNNSDTENQDACKGATVNLRYTIS